MRKYYVAFFDEFENLISSCIVKHEFSRGALREGAKQAPDNTVLIRVAEVISC